MDNAAYSLSKPNLRRCNAIVSDLYCYEAPLYSMVLSEILPIQTQRVLELGKQLEVDMKISYTSFLYYPKQWEDEIRAWPNKIQSEISSLFQVWRFYGLKEQLPW